jgi:hypothetical protein
MRTTLDIADDVLIAAKERARRENKTAGEVIYELARASLTARRDDASGNDAQKTCTGFRPFPSRGAIINNELIDSLREDDAY